MPELPEVEVVRRGLEPQLLGQTIRGIDIRQPQLRWPVPAELRHCLPGQRILSLERRSKYLLIEVTAGWLIVHLGMTGSLIWQQGGGAEQTAFSNTGRMPQHDHVVLHLDGARLVYNDPRRFGAMLWHARSAGPVSAFSLFKTLGAEPFSQAFTPGLLHKASRGRKVSIKQFLLSGMAVVGVGNIYCSEALFRARLRPTRAAGRLTLRQAEALHQEIRATLAEAIAKGGSTLRDFVNSDGQAGYFQLDYFVYGREGEPCRLCGTPVRQVRQQQRSTFFCPHCQP